MRAAIMLGVVAAVGAAGLWFYGYEDTLARIKEVESGIDQLSARRDGTMPTDETVRELVDRLGAAQSVELIDGSLEVSKEPVSDANVDELPPTARKAREAALALNRSPGGETKYETAMTLFKVRAQLVAKKFFVRTERPIARTLVLAGAPGRPR
jgi:hypothetical protein